MSQPYSISLSTSRSTHPQPSFLLLLHLPSSHTPHRRDLWENKAYAQAAVLTRLPKIQLHALTRALIPWLNSSSLALSFPGTPQRSSPQLERTGERERKGRGENRVRQRDQLNYKNNAGGLIGFASKFVLQCGMNLNGEKWEERLEDLWKPKVVFWAGGKLSRGSVKNPAK